MAFSSKSNVANSSKLAKSQVEYENWKGISCKSNLRTYSESSSSSSESNRASKACKLLFFFSSVSSIACESLLLLAEVAVEEDEEDVEFKEVDTAVVLVALSSGLSTSCSVKEIDFCSNKNKSPDLTNVRRIDKVGTKMEGRRKE